MRLAWLVTIALAGTAHADKKLLDFKPDFVREVAGCRVQANGITKVLAGATELVKTAEPGERAELERDVEQLTKGLALEQEYCDEVAAMIAFLDANAAAPYRSVERELDTRYKKIVKLRAASKKTRDELQPTTRKLIPRIARRPPPAATGAQARPRQVPERPRHRAAAAPRHVAALGLEHDRHRRLPRDPAEGPRDRRERHDAAILRRDVRPAAQGAPRPRRRRGADRSRSPRREGARGRVGRALHAPRAGHRAPGERAVRAGQGRRPARDRGRGPRRARRARRRAREAAAADDRRAAAVAAPAPQP